MKFITPQVRTQRASEFIGLDTYTEEDHLIFTKADGDKAYVGRVYEATPLVGGGQEFANVIVNVIKAVPDDSVIQVSLVSAPDHDAAETFAKNKTHGSPVVSELIARHQALIREAGQIGWREDVPALNRRRVWISLAVPIGRITPKVVEDARQQHTEFLANIKSCGFSDAVAYGAGEVIGACRQAANIFERQRPVDLDELIDLRLQVFGPDESFDFRDPRIGVLSETTFCAGVTCKAFPRKVKHGLMNLVCGAPFNRGSTLEGGGVRVATPFILTTTIRVADQRKEAERVKRAVDSRRHKQTLPFKLGDEDPAVKLADLQTLQSQCAQEGNKYVYVSTTMFVYGRTRDQVIAASSAVKGTLDKLGFDARHVVGNGIVRWAQNLPLNHAPKRAEQLANEAVMSASAAGCLLPVYGDFLGNASMASTYTGSAYITRRGSMHYHDVFKSDSNANGLIVADSGSGKSVLLQNMILCQLAEGAHVFALDNGRSLKKCCVAVGGEFNDFSGSSDGLLSINPFTGLTDDDFDEQQETITALLLTMAFDNETPASGARIAMSEAVKAAWGQRQGSAEIETVIDALRSIKDSGAENVIKNEVIVAASNLIPRLTSFMGSPSRGRYFRGKGTLNPRAQLTVFEIGSLGSDMHLRKCVLFFVLNLLANRVKSIRGRKAIFVDEALDLLADPFADVVMEGIYLKCRKDKVATWIVVQLLTKLNKMPAGPVILRQSAWKMVLAMASEEIDEVLSEKIISTFSDDPYFEKVLRSVQTVKGQYSEILILGKKSFEVVRLYLDRITGALFSSEDEARDVVFDMMSRGVDPLDAVRQLLGDSSHERQTWLRSVMGHLQSHYRLTPGQALREVERALQ